MLELLVDTNKIEFNHTSNGDDVFNGRHPCNVSELNCEKFIHWLIDKSPKILGKFLRSSNELTILNEPIPNEGNDFPPLCLAISRYITTLKSGDKTSADLLFESIKVLVADKRVDVNYTNGTTIPKPLLSVALRKGLIDLAALLIRCERTNLQILPIPSTFDCAIKNKHDDVICALLSRKDVQIDEKTKSNIFDYALNNKEQDLIKLILRYISNINNDDIIERLFDYAISINDEMVLLVLDNVKKLKDGEIARLFNYAIKNHSIKIVESILSRLKKTVDRKIIVSFNNLSDTAEKYLSALKLGRIALRPFVVEFVSTRKTILARLMNFQDPRGEAVAHKIARQILSGDEDLLNIPGVNVNQVNNEEDTPLFVAIKAQNKWCIEFLLKRTDVNVNFVNLRNKSPLMLAIESTQPDVAKLIINHQRFTTVRDCELAAAINLSQIDVLKDLIATDKVSQATVFNQAIKQESVNVVSFCLGLFKQSNLFDDINWAKLTHVKSKN